MRISLIGALEADIGVRADVGAFLGAAIEEATGRTWPEREAWARATDGHRNACPESVELADAVGISPAAVMREVSAALPQASAVVADVGQNQMWAAQSARLREGQRFLTSGGMGAMGFALPAAIGVALARPGPTGARGRW